MNVRYLLLFLIAFHLFGTPVLAQETRECDEIVNEDPKILKPWIGNNSYLLGVLEQHGIFLPEDYYRSLDNNGKYKGKDLDLRDVRNPRSQGKGKSGASGRINEFPPGGTVYYLPVKIYNHANSSGQGAFSNQDIYTYFAIPLKFLGRISEQWNFISTPSLSSQTLPTITSQATVPEKACITTTSMATH